MRSVGFRSLGIRGDTGVCEIKAAGPYQVIGFGAINVTKPYEFIWFGDIESPKPYEFKGAGGFYFANTGKISGQCRLDPTVVGAAGAADGRIKPISAQHRANTYLDSEQETETCIFYILSVFCLSFGQS